MPVPIADELSETGGFAQMPQRRLRCFRERQDFTDTPAVHAVGGVTGGPFQGAQPQRCIEQRGQEHTIALGFIWGVFIHSVQEGFFHVWMSYGSYSSPFLRAGDE
ncbi:hypothetical protein CEXT_90011 [Caerostris extrusa]|uniref:Uncharacterized protein n=1 Tax=Caerostris extrusa TaxID=172846 RepID=A0AAV4WU93_CAEEX|nr:hypothetical protein CEXT_90011 [Caerostris extrusa]